MKKVLVTWADCFSSNGWNSHSKLQNIKQSEWIIETIGFIIEETPEYLMIAKMYCEKEQRYNCVTKIPMKMIQNVRELTFVEKIFRTSKEKKGLVNKK